MSNSDQWTNLYQYLDKRFKSVDDKFSTVDKRFDDVITMIANLAGKADDDDTERAAMSGQLNRHEARLEKLEAKTG